jgi:dsRNA-specific ribonuclease
MSRLKVNKRAFLKDKQKPDRLNEPSLETGNVDIARREAFSLVQILAQKGDFIRALDEYARRLKLKRPAVVKESLSGPFHRRLVSIELSFKDSDKRIYIGSGEGSSLQNARLLAAKEIFGQLRETILEQPRTR